ncbi:hypothetical protein BXZ70DRAFT_368816 [Cristinia sonorae]|uniref:DUF6535 domain-containing protein n=1 Tax=Cristinia sonorae TaxID=1940300 RepID=A0A8K0UL29_9AGAR|nr:hypothetical protein BXZ70DRAFT_368816 [Cristinia sonorae]
MNRLTDEEKVHIEYPISDEPTRKETADTDHSFPTSSTSAHNTHGHTNTSEDETFGASDGWAKMSSYLREYDEMRVRDTKEDIDTLLTFAGLFSAVLTAFVLVSYTSFQPDNSTLSVQLLYQISMQLGAMSSNETQQLLLPDLPVYDPPASAFRINGIWFASLTCSLVTASLGMLVKQWLRQYMAGEMISPKERCRVRHFRNQGIVRWRVFEVAAFLPMLLQIALILFFIGMLDFLRLADETMCWILSGIVAVYLLFFVTTMVSPLFSAQSPFKTPLFRSLPAVSRRLMGKIARSLYRHLLHVPHHEAPIEEAELRKRNDWDVEMIVAADATFMDPQFFDNIQLCMRDFDGARRVTCIHQLIEHRVGATLPSLHTAEFAFWRLSWTERRAAVSTLIDAIHTPLVAAIEGRRR